MLGPAAALSGIGLPDAAAFAALRIAPSAPAAGAPAAPWMHLIALTLALVVVVPRLVLALACGFAAAWRSRRFALPLDEPYFQRLLRLGAGGAARVVVVPYAATPSPQATLGLRALLAATLGNTTRLDVRIAPLVPFGAEDVAPGDIGADTTHAIALFDLGATPEAEHQTRFLRTLAAALPKGAVARRGRRRLGVRASLRRPRQPRRRTARGVARCGAKARARLPSRSTSNRPTPRPPSRTCRRRFLLRRSRADERRARESSR